MLSTRSEILEKINLGEDTFLELKEVRFSSAKITEPKQAGLADELAAFANGRGGVLLLGVEDKTREILGIPRERLDAVEEMVRNTCQDSITPVLAPVIERMTLPDSAGSEVPVIRVEVSRSLFVHQSPGGYFHRIGSSKRPMQPDFLARLFQQRSQSRLIRFDEQAVPKAQMNDLSDELWERFASVRSESDRDTLLTKLGMAQRDDQDILRPSVAGILMATDDPSTWFPNAFIQAVAYQGNEVTPGSGYQLDAADIKGPLDQQIFNACHFVKKNMRTGADKQQGRIDWPQFDISAVFEAVVNAVAHRDYSIYGSKIRLHLFSDRLELYSPGTIPNSMTVETLAYRQAARNEVISGLLARCPVSAHPELNTNRSTIMDKRGEGVSIILKNTERLSGRPAVYQLIDDAELLLTIPARI
jgi:predicted HTH transcriptional regulator